MPFQAVPLLHSSTIGPGWGQAGVLSSRWSETKCLSGLPVLGRMNHILQVCCEFLGVCLCGISMTRWEWVPAAEASIAAWRRWRPGTNLQSEDVRCRFASAGWLGGHLLHPWVSMSPPIEAVCDPLQVSSMNCSREYLSKHWNSCKARDKESWWLYTELFFDIGGGQWQPGPLLPGQSTEIQASGNEALILRSFPCWVRMQIASSGGPSWFYDHHPEHPTAQSGHHSDVHKWRERELRGKWRGVSPNLGPWQKATNLMVK